MANTRYIRELVLNQPGELIGNVMNDWLAKNGYKQINYNGAVVFQAGDGFITAKDYIVLGYNNGVFHIESWIRPVSKEIKSANAPLAIGIVVISISVLIMLLTLVSDRIYTPGWIIVFLSIAGIINSNKAIKLTGNYGKAKAALVLNIIGIVLVAVMIILSLGLMLISLTL